MKESRIKRLIPKKLARELRRLGDEVSRPEMTRLVERESEEVISKMRVKGYRLATRLETGEGVFVRETKVVPLHVQLPGRAVSDARGRVPTAGGVQEARCRRGARAVFHRPKVIRLARNCCETTL